MAKLKPDTDVDIFIPPHKVTAEDRAAISEALAERRKASGYAEAVKRLDQTIQRIERAAAQRAEQSTKKAG